VLPTRGVRIGSFHGIEIYLHWSWFIIFFLILWAIITTFQASVNTPSSHYVPMAVAVTFLFFFSVLLHELSHSVVANRKGVPIRRITLFIFGGVAQMSRDVTSPGVEFRMAIAGPLTSFALAGIFALAAWAAYVLKAGTVGFGFVLLAFVNASLGLFNLVPAFPLDGGRVLRSILWGRSGNLQRSTRIVTRMGQGLGVLMISAGVVLVVIPLFAPQYNFVFTGFWFILLGLFVYQLAGVSYRQVLVRTSLQDYKVRDAMRPGVPAVEASTTLEEVYNLHLHNAPLSTVPVLQRGKLWGVVTMTGLRRVDQSSWPDTPASQVARPLPPEEMVEADQPLFDAAMMMERGGKEFLWVTEEGRLAGVIFREDLRRLANQRSGGSAA
jgi:Zn-dependent protease/CBS domain-containing protein